MAGQRAYSVYIGHIHDAIKRAQQFAAGLSFDQFAGDHRSIYATAHALEIVGEAAKRVPEEARSLEPSIPWRKMAGMRDVIIHRYDEVDLEEIWDVVQSNLEELVLPLERLQRLVEQQEDDEWERRVRGEYLPEHEQEEG